MTNIRRKTPARAFAILLAALIALVFTPFIGETGEYSAYADTPNTTDIDELTYYEISTPDDMIWLSSQVSDGVTAINAILMNDINLTDTGFTPIGTSTAGKQYTGIFDGNNKKITLSINTTAEYQGAFGYVGKEGKVHNLTVDGSVTGAKNVGGIAGLLNGGILENVTNRAKITGTSTGALTPGVGGIVGRVINTDGISSVKDAVNYGDVEADRFVGGIVGDMTPATTYESRSAIEDVVNYGSVKGVNPNVGGIAGYLNAQGSINRAVNNGKVIGSTGTVGGVIGLCIPAGTPSFTKLVNNGDVESEGTGTVGGIFGSFSNSIYLSDSYNTGKVSSSSTAVGGIIGSISTTNYTQEVNNCYNIGAITNTESGVAGGIIGSVDTKSTVQNTANVGIISSVSGSIGGISGNGTGTFSENYYLNGVAVGGNEIGTALSAVDLRTKVKTLFEDAEDLDITPLLDHCKYAIIEDQPEDITVVEGNITEVLSVEASVADEDEYTESPHTLTYQWYKADSETADLENDIRVNDATSATFAIPTGLQAGTHYYYCVVSSEDAPPIESAISDVATVTVKAGSTVGAKAAFAADLASSKKAIAQVEISADGEDKLTTQKWVTQAVYDAFSAAITAAEAASTTAAEDLTAAQTALTEARATFDAAVKSGTKAEQKITNDTVSESVATETPEAVSGEATAEINEDIVNGAIDSALTEISGNTAVKKAKIEIVVPKAVDGNSAPAEVTKVTVPIPAAVITKIEANKDKIDVVAINTQTGDFEIPGALFNNDTFGNGSSAANLSVEKTTAVPQQQKVAAADAAAVFAIELKVENTEIHNLGGDITVKIPYALKSGEKSANVKLHYLNDNGKAEEVKNASHNAATSRVEFKTNHLSYWAIKVDAKAPILSAGKITRTSATAAKIDFTTNEAGTAYYYAVTSGSAAPQTAAVKSSGKSLGAIATGKITGKSVQLTKGAKDIYVVVEDGVSNISAPLKIAADTAKVTYNSNGGKKVAAKSAKSWDEIKLPTLKRTGYTFAGWYSGSKKIGAAGAKYTVTKNITLKAKWNGKKYTVKFNANGGKVAKSSKKVTFGAKYSALPKPTRTNKTFKGWYTKKSGGAKVTASSKVKNAKNITLYAHWADKKTK
jgi:uncharacterized repeat protein (TIGR02543 family)